MRPSRLHSLRKVLCTYAVNASSLEEVDLGIEFLHSVVTNSDYSTTRLLDSGMLTDIASALHARWHLNEQLDDLNASIHLRRLVLSESSTSGTQMSSISALLTSLFLRFTHFPRMVDLIEAIELDKRALALCQMEQPRVLGPSASWRNPSWSYLTMMWTWLVLTLS